MGGTGFAFQNRSQQRRQKTFLFREKGVQTALALGDGFKLVFPCGGGDGVFQSGRRQVDDFLPQRRGYDGFFLGDEIAAFFQRLNDICLLYTSRCV